MLTARRALIEDYGYELLSARLQATLIEIETVLDDLNGKINGLWETDGRYFVSIKLLDSRNWYS